MNSKALLGRAHLKWIVLILLISVIALQWLPMPLSDNTHSSLKSKLVNQVEAQTASLPVEATKDQESTQGERSEQDLKEKIAALLDDCEAPQPEVEIDSMGRIESFLSKLENSPSQDDQYYFALFGGKANQRIQLLQEYQQRYPGNPNVMREWFRLCSVEAPTRSCDKDAIAKSQSMIPEDGSIWLNLAAYQARNGTDKDVVDALKMLNSVSNFDSPFAQSISEYLTMAQLAEGEISYTAIISAMGKEAAKVSGTNALFEWCKKHESELSTVDLCFQAGKTLANQNKDLTTLFFGIGIQKWVAETIQDYQFEPVDDRLWQQMKSESVQNHFLRISPFMNANPELVLEWLENFKQHGEIEAARRATQAVLDMAYSQPHLLCEKETE